MASTEGRLNFQSNKQQLDGLKLSHDVKKFKLLKKIIGALGYKLIDKKSAKTERLIDNYIFKIEDLLRVLINKKKITKILQIGANDGKSDDFLYKSFNKDLEGILLEPMEDAYASLKKNYEQFNKVKCLNLALDIKDQEKIFFSVNPKYFEHYKKKFSDKNVKWLNILSSFHKEHLVRHGIKDKHIISKNIKCISFKTLIDRYDFEDLDLLIIDTEGYDCTLVNNFIETMDMRPLIIFEWIHGGNDEVNKLLKKLIENNYEFFKIGRDLICFQKNFLFN